MEQKIYLSNNVAKKIEVTHALIMKRVKTVISNIERVKESQNPLQFICEDFFYKEVIQKYRGQVFAAYEMNKAFLLLVLGGLKSKKAFDLKLTMIAGLVICETELSKLMPIEKVFLMGDAVSLVHTPEKEYTARIINNWDNIFPEYKLIGQEVYLPDGDRIDLLAETINKKPVIIEVKSYSRSAHKQLRSYAVHYKDPILINLTPSIPKNKVEGVRYVSF